MWQRFTERARRVVFFAQEEAGRLGTDEVGPEHLLLGMVRENDSVAARLLDRMGVRLGAVRAEIEKRMPPPRKHALGKDMQLTKAAKRIIDLAYDEARLLDNTYIGTEHLLLGLVRAEDTSAAQVLAGQGVTLERTRNETKKLQDERPQEPKSEQDAVAKATDLISAAVERIQKRLADSAPETSPAEPAPETADLPAVGDLGTLRSGSGRAYVDVAADPDAFFALAAAYRAKDAFAYRELRDAGRFLRVPAGTAVKRLLDDRTPAAGSGATLGPFVVRLLDGEHAGRKGWVAVMAFDRTGPDDAPFPPED